MIVTEMWLYFCLLLYPIKNFPRLKRFLLDFIIYSLLNSIFNGWTTSPNLSFQSGIFLHYLDPGVKGKIKIKMKAELKTLCMHGFRNMVGWPITFYNYYPSVWKVWRPCEYNFVLSLLNVSSKARVKSTCLFVYFFSIVLS